MLAAISANLLYGTPLGLAIVMVVVVVSFVVRRLRGDRSGLGLSRDDDEREARR
jgi:hypothetical protein